MNKENKEFLHAMIGLTSLIIVGLVLVVGVIFGLSALYREYSLWSSSMEGQAELKHAEWNRQIAVKEAIAKKDAAVMLAQAEIERAKGVAEANKIIGDSLKGNEDYLRYLWIDSLGQTKDQVIYVPTEGSIPILEAGKRK
jgi:hypothetical protein